MTNVLHLPTAATAPIGKQMARGHKSRGIIPARRLRELRAERQATELHAVSERRKYCETLARVFAHLMVEADSGKCSGLLLVNRTSAGAPELCVLGDFWGARESIASVLQRLADEVSRSLGDDA